jgi:hypothetical protein
MEQSLHSSLVDWCEDDRIRILVLCETFESHGLDAVYCRAEYGITPSTSPDGQLERAVFSVRLSFGSKMLSIYCVGQDDYVLAG